MSASPIARDTSISPLVEQGYEVVVRGAYLLVMNVPYVSSESVVRRGILVCEIARTTSPLGRPPHHQAWFVGEIPCYASGQPMEALINQRGPIPLWDGFSACAYFSNKPHGVAAFETYAEKMLHYIGLIEAQAGVVEPGVTSRTRKEFSMVESPTVFKYEDMASVRASIVAVAEKLRTERIGLVGLGGTGSYILDLVAKTPVEEIHHLRWRPIQDP